MIQAQSLTLDICDSIPSNLYDQDLSSLSITNGQGYCHSFNKILDKRIRKFKSLKQLSYNDQDFYSRGQLHLPKEICKLKRLETLYTNSIIPEIFELRNLKVLGLNLSNDTAGVAYKKGFEDFTELEELQLAFSQVPVTYKLDGIASLSKLRKVTLHNPNQNVIDEVLANPNITHLIIQHSKGKSYDFSKLKELTTLSLTFCDIISIPKSVFGLSKLDTLNLTYNKISIVSQDIGKLKNLKSLSLSHNTLYSISSGIGECKELEVLGLDYNHSLSLLPKEIGKLKSLREIKANNC
ncbi:MAG: leucine-rich repeat domain-containing protein, partial [Bacteroidia bacterium]